jgi:hypothetical protein
MKTILAILAMLPFSIIYIKFIYDKRTNTHFWPIVYQIGVILSGITFLLGLYYFLF